MIGLYCPDIPPVPGGVSDHTLALARALEAQGHTPAVLARAGDPNLFAPIPCEIGLEPMGVAAAAKRHGVTCLVVQYVPFLFAHRGVSLALMRSVLSLQAAGIGRAIVVHEPFVPFTRLTWLVTGLPQRIQFSLLVRGARQVYAPLPRYAELAIAWGADPSRTQVAPIGATIPISRMPREEARAKLGLRDGQIAIGIFSPAAAGFHHAWIAEATQALSRRPTVVWVRFGFGSERDLPGYPAGSNVITLGSGDGASLGATMRALDIAAAPYTDGLTMRRSGAMLALAHGVPTVSSVGHLFDPSLGSLAACEPDAQAFAARLAQLVDDPNARARWRAAALGYDTLASMDELARRMIRDLERAA